MSGANFAVMLQELVALNNHCEVTWDYILGAPLEDLPIVEQIPILHRLGKCSCDVGENVYKCIKS